MSRSSVSEIDTDVPTLPKKRKRGIRNDHCYKREIQKRHRLLGKAYVSTSTGNIVPAKSNISGSCPCKLKCTSNFNTEDRKHILNNLHQKQSKYAQDEFLMSLIERCEIKRRRSRSDNPSKRENVFNFFVLNKDGERIKVCRNAFSVLYAIKPRALFRLATLTASGKPPIDRRGKHVNRGNSLPPQVYEDIDNHLKDFAVHHSYFYLSGDLDIKTLHRLFCEKYPQYLTRVKYDFYLKYYHANYGSGAGTSQTDACDMTIKFQVKEESE